MAIPPAAAVPAIPTKCPLPMLLANREAPICKEKKQKLVLMFKGTAEKCPSFGTLSSLWWCCCWQWLTINSSIDFRTPTGTRAPSITSTVLRENRMVNQISSSWVKKYITLIQIFKCLQNLPDWHWGDIQAIREEDCDLPCSRRRWAGHPSCHCCTLCSTLHSLWSKCAPAESWTWLTVANRYLITELNSASCTAGMFAEEVAARSSSKSRSYI